MKNESPNNANHLKNNDNNIFPFIFCKWNRIYFARKHSLGKCDLYYYISSKLFRVAEYLNEIIKHQHPYRSAMVL